MENTWEIYIGKGPYGAYLNIKKGDKGKNTGIQKYLELINKDVDTIKFSEILDCPDMRLLGFIAHPANAHIFHHPRTQRAHLLVCHENLLSD